MMTESLSDMEVILDFLEEQYYGETGGGDDDDACQKLEEIFMNREMPAVNDTYEQYCSHWEFNVPLDDAAAAFSPHSDAVPLFGSVPSSMHARQPSKPHTKTAADLQAHTASQRRGGGAGGGGGKLRLFRFLFEVLEDPGMAHCVSWVPSASDAGVFRFSSRNKEQVAALWGQRKGNKRPMTYQKMSRALRNYGRSGEIFKVKKKLTYQFSGDTLRSLRQSCRHRHL